MNDPHVVALIYRIHHGDHVDYKNAGPRMIDYQHFSVEVGGQSARVSLKSHFSSREEARQAVEPVLRAWELHQALEYGPQTIEFIYERSEIVDRAPTLGQHSLIAEPLHFKVEFGRPKLTLNFAAFPVPAQNLARDEVVDHMFERYCLYKQGGTLLAEAANFCLTHLEEACRVDRKEKGLREKAASPHFSPGARPASGVPIRGHRELARLLYRDVFWAGGPDG